MSGKLSQQSVSTNSGRHWTRNRGLRHAAGAIALFCAGSSVHAGILFWDTATTAGIQTANGTWDFNTTADWSSSTAGSNPLLTWTSNSDTASFQVAASNTVTINGVNGQVGAAGLIFTGTGAGGVFTIAPLSTETLELGAGGITSTASNEIVSISAPVVLTASQTWSSSALRNNNGGADMKAVGSISGTANLIFDGMGVSNPTLTGNTNPRVGILLGGSNSFAGTSTVTGGAALWLDFNGTNVGSRLDPNSALILSGGSIIMNGGGVGNNILQIVASTTIGAGDNTLFAGANGGGGTTNKIQLGALTHQVGGVLDVTNAVAGLASTTTLNTDNIIGGWATTGGTTWATGATVAGTNTNISGTSGSSRASSSAWLTTDNVSSTVSEAGIGSKTVNALLLKTASMSLGFAPGSVLTLTSGGLMSGSTGQSLTGGSIQPGTPSGELFVHTANPFTLTSAIVDNGATPTILVKAGASTLTMSGANTYSGGTYIDGGTLQVTGSSAIGGAITQQGATTLDVRSGGTIAPGTAAAADTMTLGGNLTLEDGAVANFRLGTNPDLIQMSNSFATLTGSTSADGINLNLTDGGGLTTQTYTLMAWQPGTVLTSFDLSDFNVTTPNGVTGTLQFGTNSLIYTVASLGVVPEPATLGVLALGGLGLLLSRRRRE